MSRPRLTRRQAEAALAAVTAMLAGEEGEGDWPEDVSAVALRGAARWLRSRVGAAVDDDGGLDVRLPADVVVAVNKYHATDWSDGRDPSKFGALNAVAYIGERVIALVPPARGGS